MKVERCLKKLKEILELYRLFRSPGGKIISFPSGKGGVGKTLISLHVGAALALQSFSVAVVDLNLALPNLHSYARELPEMTVTHFLTGVCRVKDVKSVSVKVRDVTMHIYPSRSIVDLAKKPDLSKLPAFLTNVKSLYDYVILDLPPGMTRYSTYPASLSDCIVVVTADERASYLDATKLAKALELSGVKITGFVVNKYEGRRSVNLDKVVGVIPFDERIRKFPEVWSKKYFRPKFLKNISELAYSISRIC